MISLTELNVTAETGQTVRLSRYTNEQFRGLFPLPESNFTYIPTEYIEAGYGNPDQELDAILGTWAVTCWGIFIPYGETDQMVGDISLSDISISSGRERNLDTRIAREDAHGRGVGTLSKAALVSFALSRDAVAVRSVTANPASKVSLSKLGFVNYGPLDPPEICGHEKVLLEREHFVLWNDPSDAPDRRTEAYGGRSRFDNFLKTLRITERVVWPDD